MFCIQRRFRNQNLKNEKNWKKDILFKTNKKCSFTIPTGPLMQ